MQRPTAFAPVSQWRRCELLRTVIVVDRRAWQGAPWSWDRESIRRRNRAQQVRTRTSTGGRWTTYGAGRVVASELPLRGRESELKALDAAIDAVVDGRQRVVLIEGSAGFGKSHLLREAADRAHAAGLQVAVGGADPDVRDSPFFAFLSALSTGPDPVLTRDRLRVLQGLRNDRYWFMLEISDALERAALGAPLLIGLDDLQWADGSTVDAVRTLSGQLGSTPILWVLTFRPRHDSVALGRLVAELDGAKTTLLELDPLDAPAVREVIVDHLHATPDAGFVEAVAAADGVPFFLVRSLRGLLDGGMVEVSGTVATVRDADELGSVVGVGELLSGLSTPARQIAQVGAVLGRTFRSDEVATMLDLGPSNLIEPLDELIRADILVTTSDRWAFRHDIIREAVLDSMPVPIRRTLERTAADVLLAAGIPPVDVARRVAAGAEPGDQRAIDTLMAAARSLLTTDPSTAAELSKHAVLLTPLDDPMRAGFAAETVIGLHLAGREDDALRFAGEVLPEVSEPERYSELQLGISKMYSLPAGTRVECGHRGLAATGISDALRARHLAVMVLSHAASGDVQAARRVAAEAAAVLAQAPDAHAALSLEFSLMTLDEASYRYADALGRVATIRQQASATGDEAPALAAEWLRANVLVSLDEFQQAWDVSTGAQRFAREHRQAWITARWDFWQGWFLLQRGRLSDTRAVLDGAMAAEGLEIATALPDACGIAALGRLARHMGDQRLTDRCVRVARASLALDTADDARRHLGWFLVAESLAANDSSAARDALAAITVGSIVLPVLSVDVGFEVEVVRAGRQLGDDELSATAARAARERAELNPGSSSLAAAAAHATGLHRNDIEDLGTATTLLQSGSRPIAAASAFEDLGRLLIERSDIAGATEALGLSLEFAVAAGAVWDARRVRRRLRAIGVRRRLSAPARPEHGWDALTPAELAVATKVGDGMTNRETADALFVSPHTVGAHLRHVFEKLGIRSRVELARMVSARERPATSG